MPKPSLIQCVLCVVIILSIQALLMWLDNAPTEDLRFVLIAIPLTAIACWAARRINGRGR